MGEAFEGSLTLIFRHSNFGILVTKDFAFIQKNIKFLIRNNCRIFIDEKMKSKIHFLVIKFSHALKICRRPYIYLKLFSSWVTLYKRYLMSNSNPKTACKCIPYNYTFTLYYSHVSVWKFISHYMNTFLLSNWSSNNHFHLYMRRKYNVHGTLSIKNYSLLRSNFYFFTLFA